MRNTPEVSAHMKCNLMTIDGGCYMVYNAHLLSTIAIHNEPYFVFLLSLPHHPITYREDQGKLGLEVNLEQHR